MRTRIWIIGMALALVCGCTARHGEVVRQLEKLKSESSEPYPVAYATATYLATAEDLEPGQAIPLVLELISMKYYTEARYSLDNLFRNGIYSHDLLALRGLCYFNEMQPELARTDLDKALEGDPGNEKIRTLWNQVHGKAEPAETAGQRIDRARQLLLQGDAARSDRILGSVLLEDPVSHPALFLKGRIRIQDGRYDSALYFMQFARSIEDRPEYARAIKALEQVIGAEEVISREPSGFQGYLQKSQGLSSLGVFDAAQAELNRGLERIPENRNLLLAKALVWVQAGDRETAVRYLGELEQRGMSISPELKQQILQNPSP